MKQQVYNPYLPLYECIPDGEPHVFGDRVYIYGSHDKEGGETFCMLDYTTYSAPVTDLSDWRCEGTIYRADQDPAYPTDRKFMYAPDVVQGNDGRFYLYYCMSGRAGFGGYNGPISVAVSDSPAGPFRYLGFVRYPDGSPMLKYVCFDPGVINDNGTIRIYYGTWSDEQLDKDFRNKEDLIQTVMQRYHKSRNEVLDTEGSVMGPCTVTVGDDMMTVTSERRNSLSAIFTPDCIWFISLVILVIRVEIPTVSISVNESDSICLKSPCLKFVGNPAAALAAKYCAVIELKSPTAAKSIRTPP